MNPIEYSEDQKKDINERVEKAKQFLLENNLQPGVVMQAINLRDDVFGMKPIPYLQDTFYKNVLSPIQNP